MATTANTYHVPVLLHESVDGLAITPGGVYVDVTFGGGGHSREILSRLVGGGRLYSFDQDADAEKNIWAAPEGAMEFSEGSAPEEKGNAESCVTPSSPHGETGKGHGGSFTFVRSNFRYLRNWMRYHGEDHIDGLLADLGVSSHHLDDESRGFSFRFDAPLDMRMNRRAGLTAADVVNSYDEQRLADIIYLYGELRQARRLASAIVAARSQRRIETTADLLAATEPLMRRDREKKDTARLFQALRIEVNHEMDALREMLTAAIGLLAPGGRLSVITYHSLEDRIVKNFIKTGNAEGRLTQDFFGRTEAPLKAVNTKVIVPSADEQERNPRSRSAKLRVAEKI